MECFDRALEAGVACGVPQGGLHDPPLSLCRRRHRHGGERPGAGGQEGRKKFLKKPLVIEDQGSFFIGGVPKVTDYATPSPPPGRAAARRRRPQQITIGQMYVQFQIPANKKRGHGRSSWCTARRTRRRAWSRRRTAAKAGIPTSCARASPTYVVDQAGRGRSGFDESVIHEGEADDRGRRRRRAGRR